MGTSSQRFRHAPKIIGGQFRQHKLTTPPGFETRPTSLRARESLFSYIASKWSDIIPSRYVVDLFAGCGAIGLEALSRGAGFCLFGECRPAAIASISQNLEKLKIKHQAEIYKKNLLYADWPIIAEKAGLVFADPPYDFKSYTPFFKQLKRSRWLEQNSLVILQYDPEQVPPIIPEWLLCHKQYNVGRNGFYVLTLK
ncbi:MAG: 16S rRNA (guanine(966)-N(2))-methyltransferase RsmD [Pseudomonadota bacterium]